MGVGSGVDFLASSTASVMMLMVATPETDQPAIISVFHKASSSFNSSKFSHCSGVSVSGVGQRSGSVVSIIVVDVVEVVDVGHVRSLTSIRMLTRSRAKIKSSVLPLDSIIIYSFRML